MKILQNHWLNLNVEKKEKYFVGKWAVWSREELLDSSCFFEQHRDTDTFSSQHITIKKQELGMILKYEEKFFNLNTENLPTECSE